MTAIFWHLYLQTELNSGRGLLGIVFWWGNKNRLSILDGIENTSLIYGENLWGNDWTFSILFLNFLVCQVLTLYIIYTLKKISHEVMTKKNIYIYIYIYREREREREVIKQIKIFICSYLFLIVLN